MLLCTALCAIGAEKVLGNELKQLGFTLSAPETHGGYAGRVRFSVPAWEDLYRANLCLRTADRVFLEAASFRAEDFDSLYEGTYRADWQDFFKKNVRVTVDKVRTHGSRLASEHSVQTVVHKALSKKLCDSFRMVNLPESGAEQAVRVYVDNGLVTLGVDTSGEALHKRGYRTQGGDAPLRETLAAVLLHLALWRRKLPLHDPFCGSGTIPCEALLYAYNAPPGIGRSFALENLAFFDRRRAEDVRRREAEKIRSDWVVRITGSDIDPNAVEAARGNAERACVTIGRALQLTGRDGRIERPRFTPEDFSSLKAPWEEGVLLGNPPYGERMGGPEAAEEVYRTMGVLFDTFPGWKKGFITSHGDFEKAIGRRAGQTWALKSGKLDTYFYFFGETHVNRCGT
ncbi:MAG: class I SAM-dependent RNA methyltransferase [Spirochaetaceae bacterium]|jgi:putative N6-adenine-specific DNA methylase|nr:class I SAM-dependent RNA methyltransferase [Spirochaetaceae bacterium]